MKKFKKAILIVLLVFVLTLGLLVLAAAATFSIQTNRDLFELSSTHEMITSEYNSNGSFWGHNQSKLASIGEVIFTFHYDNQNLVNGNSSDTNPYYSYFIMIVDGEEVQFDFGTCNRPGNVITDELNNKVYYILSEPAGPASDGGNDYSSYSQTVMYEYDFDPNTLDTLLVEKHIVTPVTSDGKIRQGVAIDDFGNIAIAYGTYDGYIVIYTYDYSFRIFEEYRYLSNTDFDSLMYCNVDILDLNHVYVLAEQDTSRDGHTFYQYVMFFALENNIWFSQMVVDYRNSDLAQKYDKMVINCDLMIVEGVVHMGAASSKANEVTYLTYENGGINIQDTSYFPRGTANFQFIEVDGELYVATMSFISQIFLPTFSILSVNEQKIVYKIVSVMNNRYFYLDVMDDRIINLLIYGINKGKLYSIAFKQE